MLLLSRQKECHISLAIDEADIRHSFVIVETVRYLVVDVVNVVETLC